MFIPADSVEDYSAARACEQTRNDNEELADAARTGEYSARTQQLSGRERLAGD